MKKQDKNNYSRKEALSNLTRICSKREICSHEAIKKLKDWGLPDSDTSEIITFLINEKYIDDLRYSAHFASDKFRFNKWGKNKIAFALKQKHIPELTISMAIENFPDEEYKQFVREEIIKKLNSLPKLSNYELKGKLYRFAMGRGFENDLVMELLDELNSELVVKKNTNKKRRKI